MQTSAGFWPCSMRAEKFKSQEVASKEIAAGHFPFASW
jgi:hypothetical protein